MHTDSAMTAEFQIEHHGRGAGDGESLPRRSFSMRICSGAKTLSQWLEAAVHVGAFLLLWLTSASAGQAQEFTYSNTNGTITITGYTGPGGAVTIPSTISGVPVTSIGGSAFWGNGS